MSINNNKMAIVAPPHLFASYLYVLSGQQHQRKENMILEILGSRCYYPITQLIHKIKDQASWGSNQTQTNFYWQNLKVHKIQI